MLFLLDETRNDLDTETDETNRIQSRVSNDGEKTAEIIYEKTTVIRITRECSKRKVVSHAVFPFSLPPTGRKLRNHAAGQSMKSVPYFNCLSIEN